MDEAYVDFAASEGASSIPLLSRLPNLVVLRTFSKSFSLAGMRIGLAFAAEEIIAGMMKVKDSYNLNRLSLIAATAALADLPWMGRNVRRIQRGRKRLTSGLKRLGYDVYPSHANFILARKQGQNQKSVYEELKRRKIFVRYFDLPGLQDCLRITVGAPVEIQALLTEMAAIAGSRETGCSDSCAKGGLVMARIKITDLDHIVLNVGDIEQSLKFYTEVLGLSGERVDEFKAGKVGFPSVRINAANDHRLVSEQGTFGSTCRRQSRRQLESFLPGGRRRRFCRHRRLSERKANRASAKGRCRAGARVAGRPRFISSIPTATRSRFGRTEEIGVME